VSDARPKPAAFGDADLSGRRFTIVCARFNSEVTDGLLSGALRCLNELGAAPDSVRVHRVPGAWELPQACARVVSAAEADAVIALGCVVRGETQHFDYVCGRAALGLGALADAAPIPVTFGVLTADTMEQALARSGDDGKNKGREAAAAAAEMIAVFGRIGG